MSGMLAGLAFLFLWVQLETDPYQGGKGCFLSCGEEGKEGGFDC